MANGTHAAIERHTHSHTAHNLQALAELGNIRVAQPTDSHTYIYLHGRAAALSSQFPRSTQPNSMRCSTCTHACFSTHTWRMLQRHPANSADRGSYMFDTPSKRFKVFGQTLTLYWTLSGQHAAVHICVNTLRHVCWRFMRIVTYSVVCVVFALACDQRSLCRSARRAFTFIFGCTYF